MIKKILLRIRELIDSILGVSPGRESPQQNITVTGNDNIIVINGNKTKSNLILPKNQNKVKHFSQEFAAENREKRG